ncbi:MAG TPA: PPC domain-containing protein [Gemmatimonadales bacterium]|nr:PPC domain-containing protein [Gemmatimonadales bacterium]
MLGLAAVAGLEPLAAQQADHAHPLAVHPPGAAPSGPAPAANEVPAPGETGFIRVGQTMRGALEPGDLLMADSTFADVWEFTGAAGEKVTIEARSDEFDTFLQLLDSSGTKIAEDDDSGGDLNSRLAVTLPAAGRYRIVVNSAGHERRAGRYTVSIQ